MNNKLLLLIYQEKNVCKTIYRINLSIDGKISVFYIF